MKIYDCFTFLNELELLDLRLMTLNDIVDYFVIVEANRTHTGNPKDFIFKKNIDEFDKYLNKIIYVQVEDLPKYQSSNHWGPENFQRNCITRGLIRNGITEEDKIIISDLDEIPNPNIIINNLNTDDLLVMEQRLFYYYVNCIQHQLWRGSIITTYHPRLILQELRHSARGMLGGVKLNEFGRGIHVLPNGGWHYSFMGGPEQIRYKVENIAESKEIINRIGDVEFIKHKMLTQTDLWGRTENYAQKTIVDITQENMSPGCIQEFINKYPYFYFSGEGF